MNNVNFDDAQYSDIANKLLEYAKRANIEFSNDQKQSHYEEYQTFEKLFGPNALKFKDGKALEGEELLNYIFYNLSNPSSLAYYIVRDKYGIGAVGGAREIHFGIKFSKEKNIWQDWNKKEIALVDAIKIGTHIRDALVKSCEILKDEITKSDLSTIGAYKDLNNKIKPILSNIDGFNFYGKKVILHKYFSCLASFNNYFSFFQNLDKYKVVLDDLNLKLDAKGDDWIIGDGHFVLLRKACNLTAEQFDHLIHSIFYKFEPGSSNPIYRDPKVNDPIYQSIFGINQSSQYDDHNEATNANDPLENKSQNRILFGAPGIGKSYKLNEELKNLKNYEFERVTFHPDYTYANFIGSYKPVSKENKQPELSDTTKSVVKILIDKSTTAQMKFDELLRMKLDGKKLDLNFIYTILALVTDDDFNNEASGKEGKENAYSCNAKSTGKKLREYVRLINDFDFNQKISYEYIPGPFMRLYVKALNNPDKPHILIIEEINRANTAAVFGDLFQLLDRNTDGSSEYSIQASEDQKIYLEKQLGKVQDINNRMSTENNPFDCISQIKIPNNMYIWATMNSADQGVFYLDTAFKRRWNFEYIGVDEGEDQIENLYYEYTNTKDHKTYKVNWNCLRKAINDFLVEQNVNEDKLLGTFFLNPSSITKDDQIDKEKFNQLFKNKILMYLFEDAARHKRVDLFAGCKDEQNRKLFSRICKEFDTKNIEIFNEEIWNKEKVCIELKSNEESNSNSSESLEKINEE